MNVFDDADAKNQETGRHRIDGKLGEAVAGAGRVRWCARLTALVTAGVCTAVGGEPWLIGALLGGLVVEINLTLLIRTLTRAARWQGQSMWPTLIWFYLIFGATALVCLVVVRGGFSHPLAFLLGLLSFFIGLVLALLSFVVSKPKTGSGHE